MTGLNALIPQAQEQRFYGVTIGVVTNNKDPKQLGRVKVTFPWLPEMEKKEEGKVGKVPVDSAWARVATLMAGKDRGIYFLPKVDDEVLVAFEHGDINFPYVLGSLWNGKDKPIETSEDCENIKHTIKSLSGLTIRLDDTKDSERIEITDKEGKNFIKIQVADKKITITADTEITITADNNITLQANKGKLKLSGNGIEMTSQAEIKIEATNNMDLKAGPQLNINGSTVNIN